LLFKAIIRKAKKTQHIQFGSDREKGNTDRFDFYLVIDKNRMCLHQIFRLKKDPEGYTS
jgi:hypothetical protein